MCLNRQHDFGKVGGVQQTHQIPKAGGGGGGLGLKGGNGKGQESRHGREGRWSPVRAAAGSSTGIYCEKDARASSESEPVLIYPSRPILAAGPLMARQTPKKGGKIVEKESETGFRIA
jgi:hypothetical protein